MAESKEKTIARSLITYSVTAAVLIALLSAVVAFSINFYLIKAEYRSKSGEFLNHLVKALEQPLWTMDEQTAKEICKAFLSTDYIAELQLMNSSNQVIFSAKKPEETSQFSMESSIKYEGRILGTVSVGTSYNQAIKDLLKTFALQQLVIVLIISAISAVIFLLVKRNIVKPIRRFAECLKNIEEGHYEIPNAKPRHKELALMMNQLISMAEKIKSREEALQKLGTDLQNEILEKEKNLKDLKASESRFRAVMNAANDGVLIAKHDGRIIYANKAIQSLFKYEEEELYRRVICHLFSEKDHDLLKRFVIRRENLEGVLYEMEGMTKDKTPVFLEVSIARTATGNGEKDQVVLIVRDISWRKTIEKEKAETFEQVLRLQKLEAVGTLAGGVAHDFNNILTVIMGFTDLSKGVVPLESPAKEYLAQIESACKRARDLVAQILSISRPQIFEKIVFNPSSLIKETIKFLRATLPSNITIEHHVSSENMAIEADPSQIQQIMMNLCTNSAHAMEQQDQGNLLIILDKSIIGESKKCFFTVLPPGEYVHLQVSDDGCGIAPEVLNRIFDPYFTTKKPDRGTGLGLSIVRSIVESHNGHIQVESVVGKGSSFHIYFPIVKTFTFETPVKSKEVVSIEDTKKNIIFVDDEADIVNLVSTALNTLGYRVSSFTDPEKALEYFKNNMEKVNLIITDITMPKLQGDKLAQAISSLKPNIPIIFCTGHSTTLSQVKVSNINIRSVLCKPFTVNDLLDEIAKAFRDDKKQN